MLEPEQLARPLLVSFTQWDFAVGAVAETVMTLHGMGSEVTVALWADETPMRDIGWQVQHTFAALLGSPSIDQRLRSALSAAGLPAWAFASPPIPRWRPAEPIALPPVLTRGAIRDVTYRGTAMGRAILQVPPSPMTPTTDSYVWPRRFVQRSAKSYAFVYDQALELIRQRDITCVISYNGRFLHDRPVAAAAETLGLPVLAYDSGGSDTDFDLTREPTHDWSAYQQRMLRMYETWAPDERAALGREWFEDRIAHADPANARFTGGQTRGRGIEPDSARPTAVYFSSSNDEIAELEISWDQYFGSQASALKQAADACRGQGYRLVVRTHPHKRHKPPEDLSEWLAAVSVAQPDVHLDQNSNVDSYTLMRQADVVLTYGSTTGIEAAYLGRPVIVMGPSIYDELGCATRVRTREELDVALAGPVVGSHDVTLAVGLMIKRRGFAYSYVEWDGVGDRVLAGVPLTEPSETVRHLSDRWRRIHHAWLTR